MAWLDLCSMWRKFIKQLVIDPSSNLQANCVVRSVSNQLFLCWQPFIGCFVLFCRDMSMYLLAIFELCAQIPILMIGFAPENQWKINFLFGMPIFMCKLLVSGKVYRIISYYIYIYIYPIPIFFVLHLAQYHFWCLNQILIASDKSILPRIRSTSQRVFRSTTWRIFGKTRMWRAAHSAYVSIWGFKIPAPCHVSRKREKTRKFSRSCSLQPLTTTLYHNIL